MTDAEQTLIDAGYVVGEKVTVNIAPGFVLAGTAVIALELARPWLGLGQTPPILFLLWICFAFGVAATWHHRRPKVVYERDGLWIGDGLWPWTTVRSVAVTSWVITVTVARPDGSGAFTLVAVRSRARSTRTR